MKSIKNSYSNDNLDNIICYFMKVILHLEKSGIEDLPLENHFKEPLKSFVSISIDMIMGGELPEISHLILSAEYDALVKGKEVSVETILNLQLIKELSEHIHYDEDYYGYLLSLSNLWGNKIFEYATRTFYPNMPEAAKMKYHIYDFLKYVPQEMYQLDDF